MRPVLVLALLGFAACRSLTPIASEDPTEIRASLPPLPPEQPDPVQQPPPPPRVKLVEADEIWLDEAIAFDATGALEAESDDILDELGAWLETHVEVAQVGIEGRPAKAQAKSARAQTKLGKAMAGVVVDALVARGVERERLVAVGAPADDEPARVVLRVIERETVEVVR